MSGKGAREARQATLDQVRNGQKKAERKRMAVMVTLIALPAIILITIASLVIYNGSKGSGLETVPPSAAGMGQPMSINPDAPADARSEERRVGKECPV